MLLSSTRVPEAVDVTNETDACALMEYLSAKPTIALDTETTGLHRTESRTHPASHVVVWSLSDGRGRWCLPRSLLPVFKGWLEDPSRVIIMHNAAFDTWMLRNSGVELMNTRRWRRRDTMVMHSLLDTAEGAQHDLKWIGRHILGLDTKSFKATFGGGRKTSTEDLLLQADPHMRSDYASLDAWMTAAAYKQFSRELVEKDLWDLYQELEGPIGDILVRMEYRGIAVDVPYLEVLGPRVEHEIRAIESEFIQQAGIIINLSSTDQMRSFFYDRMGHKVTKWTKGGEKGNMRPSVDEEMLAEWARAGDIFAQQLLRHRALRKLHGTYVKGLLECVHPNGRISTSLNQHVARTGRLTSSEPNLQNIAKEDEFGIRKAFIAGPGKELLCFDFSMLELRVAALLSKDENLVGAIKAGQDLHASTAALLFHVPYDVVMLAKKAAAPTKEQQHLRHLRDNVAKRINFGIVYGMGAPRLAHDLNCARDEAQGYIDHFFLAYPGLKRWMDRVVADCEQCGYVTTLSGRQRSLGGIIAAHPQTRNEAIRQSVNTPIQGGASDIVKLVMKKIDADPKLAAAGAEMLLQIHDEILIELPKGAGEGLTERIRELAVDPFDGEVLVPWAVDIGIGQNWKEAKK